MPETETPEAPVVPEEVELPPLLVPRTVPREETRTKRQPPYAVILHNDDINGMDFVVGALRKVFHFSYWKAITLMLQAHCTGRCIVWTGSLEVAELKADQLRSCGADPNMAHRGAQPLTVTVEPLP